MRYFRCQMTGSPVARLASTVSCLGSTGRGARIVPVFAVALLVVACTPSSEDLYVGDLPERVDFNFHVKPILSDRCFACHGPDEAARQAELRLDTETGARTVIHGGSLRRSELFRRITSADPDEVMPPSDSHLSLSDYERAILARWIEQGAEWKPHWSFIPPEKPSEPEVKQGGWAANPIDRFVLARLEREGLVPSPAASRERLIRRVTYDLTGLPPTLPEVDAFLADRSPNAYDKVVDRLLASPAYGERMATQWMDLARYADSHGYQDDGIREMWPWRDWVIDAFNRNQPYDEFVTWQLAGDLLPDATPEQILATGFNRNHPQNSEGGSIEAEFLVEYAADRTNTFGKAFLGLTVECARCHDHKYDPVSQKNYYELLGFFNNVDEVVPISNAGNSGPMIPLPSPGEQARLDEARGDIAARERTLREYAARADVPANAAASLRAGLSSDPPGLVAHYPLDRLEPDGFRNRRNPRQFAEVVDTVRVAEGRSGGAAEVKSDGHLQLGEIGLFERTDPFTIGLWVYIAKGEKDLLLLGTQQERIQEIATGREGRGYGLYLLDRRLAVQLGHQRPDNLIYVTASDSLPLKEWTHVALTYDGSSRAAGVQLYMNGQPLRTDVLLDRLYKTMSLPAGPRAQLRVARINGDGATHSRLDGSRFDELMIFDRVLTPLEVVGIAGDREKIDELASRPPERWTPAERRDLRDYHLQTRDAAFRRGLAELKQLRERENELIDPIPEVMVMLERERVRPTFILDRGAYDSPTERVERGTPESILPFPEDLPRDRRGLARWLFAPENPLTARVAVNRYWQMLFGTGLVKTSDDFGNQGDLPTHPALLDWLAVTYRGNGWDTKALLRTIVTSSTYRQSSRITSELRERDPENRLLARGPSHRLPAEMVRDGALASSGLLVDSVGGPSVKPYQPEGLWEEKTSGRGGLAVYIQDHGDDLYRRSLYTFRKRSSPPPMMSIFDADDRNVCTVRRQRTNTPLQALNLLNDPQFVEASRLLAERMIREGGPTTADRIRFGFRAVTSRPPSPWELEVLGSLYEKRLGNYQLDRPGALRLLATGEHPRNESLDAAEAAAFTMVATTLLNLDEALTKR